MRKINSFKNLRYKADVGSIQDAITLLSISQSMLYQIESWKKDPGRDLCLKMAEVYKCSIEDIYKAVDENKKGRVKNDGVHNCKTNGRKAEYKSKARI